MKIQYFFQFILVAIFFSCDLSAIYVKEDENEIDRETHLEPELYTDKISYTLPYDWEERFIDADYGYINSQGSKNQFELITNEKIKLQFYGKDSPYFFTFLGRRNSDQIRQEEYMEIYLGRKIYSNFQLALAGWPTYNKKWGNLGFLVKYVQDKRNYFSVKYISTHHYYNFKTEDGSKYYKKPGTLEFEEETFLGNSFRTKVTYTFDTLLNKEDLNKGLVNYYNERRFLESRFDYYTSDLSFVGISYDDEIKGEGFDFVAPTIALPDRELLRRVKHYGLHFKNGPDKRQYFMTGIKYAKREVDITAQPVSESFGVNRDDYIGYFFYYYPFNPDHRLNTTYTFVETFRDQTGGADNKYHFQDNNQKLTFAWEVTWNEYVQASFLLSMDVEEVTSHPFDGGNISVVATF